jgi:hypothetical protein
LCGLGKSSPEEIRKFVVWLGCMIGEYDGGSSVDGYMVMMVEA